MMTLYLDRFTFHRTVLQGDAEFIILPLLCTLPGQRPGIAEGNERTRLGRVHLYFFAIVLIIVL